MNRRHFLAATFAGSVALAAKAADSDRKLRVAVIGHTGHGDYGHGVDTMWLHVSGVELVAVADAVPEGLANAQKKLNLARGYADYRQMLAETKPDLVAIAPRHLNEHRDMTLAAIESGAQGIYMEKPFCRTLAEADEIIAAADRRKVKIALAHRNRYHPVLPVIQRMLTENALGQVLEIRMRGKEDARGGAEDLWVLGTHLLNLAAFFGGAPRACTATLLEDSRPVTKADVHDGPEGIGLIAGNAAHARFEMANGYPVFFDSIAKAGAPPGVFGLQIIGTKGVIDLRLDTDPLAHVCIGNPFDPGGEARKWLPISTAGPDQPEPVPNIKEQVENHIYGAHDLIAAIREDRAPLCSAADGRTIVEMITAVFESHRLNGQRVNFPLAIPDNPLARLS
jgi:predicted dehydrogenase